MAAPKNGEGDKKKAGCFQKLVFCFLRNLNLARAVHTNETAILAL
jgi:hypothetical protein